MPWFGQELFEKAEAYGGLDAKEYLDSLAECRKGARDDGLDRVLKANRLDALVAPTGGPAWLIDPVNGDHFGRELLVAGGGGGLSAPHGAGRLRPRPAGRPLVRRRRVERGEAARARPRLREGDGAAPRAALREANDARLKDANPRVGRADYLEASSSDSGARARRSRSIAAQEAPRSRFAAGTRRALRPPRADPREPARAPSRRPSKPCARARRAEIGGRVRVAQARQQGEIARRRRRAPRPRSRTRRAP